MAGPGDRHIRLDDAGDAATPGWHSAIYYVVFLAFVGWALVRGAARSGIEQPVAAALATLLIPAASLIAGRSWYAAGASIAVDLTAIAIAAALLVTALSARRRARSGPRDSVWAAPLQV